MASCKDCLHVDVCCSYLSTAYNKCKLATPDFKLLKNIQCDECQHFKDRSRFVELPCERGDGVLITDNHFADVSKKDTMSLTLALIVLDRLNTSERIDVARDNLAEAVRVVSAAAKYRIPQKPEKSKSYWATSKAKTCPTCKYGVFLGNPKFCSHCGQALDWR